MYIRPRPESPEHVRHRARTGHCGLMLTVLFVSVAPLLAVAQQPAEISDEDLKSINEANNLDLK